MMRPLSACLVLVIVCAGPLHGVDRSGEPPSVGRRLQWYVWLVDHDEYRAAEKLAAELQRMHPDDPQVQATVTNAQIRRRIANSNMHHSATFDDPNLVQTVDHGAAPTGAVTTDDKPGILDDVNGWWCPDVPMIPAEARLGTDDELDRPASR